MAARLRPGIGRRRAVGPRSGQSHRCQPAPEIIGKVNRRAVSVRHPLAQASQTDPLQLARYRIIDLTQRLGVAVQDLVEERRAIAGDKRQATGQAFVKHDSEAQMSVRPSRR